MSLERKMPEHGPSRVDPAAKKIIEKPKKRVLPETASGKELEVALLGGQVKAEARFEKTGYLPYEKAVEVVKDNQPEGWDPAEPPGVKNSFIPDLHYAVQEKLAQSLHDLPDLSQAASEIGALKFYTAVDSVLDIKHGVDAFFTFPTESLAGAKEALVSLDTTYNPEKADYKADVRVYLDPRAYNEMPQKEQDKTVDGFARQISKYLTGKIVSELLAKRRIDSGRARKILEAIK